MSKRDAYDLMLANFLRILYFDGGKEVDAS
jgi:hypothetical protein